MILLLADQTSWALPTVQYNRYGQWPASLLLSYVSMKVDSHASRGPYPKGIAPQTCHGGNPRILKVQCMSGISETVKNAMPPLDCSLQVLGLFPDLFPLRYSLNVIGMLNMRDTTA